METGVISINVSFKVVVFMLKILEVKGSLLGSVILQETPVHIFTVHATGPTVCASTIVVEQPRTLSKTLNKVQHRMGLLNFNADTIRRIETNKQKIIYFEHPHPKASMT